MLETDWTSLEAKRAVKPTFTGRQASAALAALNSAEEDARADGASDTARVLKGAADAIRKVA